MKLRAAVMLAAVLLPAACRSTPPPVQFTAAQRAAFEARRQADAGLEPVATLAARGIDVQRVDFSFGLLPSPKVELARSADGEVRLALIYSGRRESVRVGAELWDQLAARVEAGHLAADARAFRRRMRRIHVCHDWQLIEIRIGARQDRVTATPCAGDVHAGPLSYGAALGRAAVDRLPRCAPWRGEPSLETALGSCARAVPPIEPG